MFHTVKVSFLLLLKNQLMVLFIALGMIFSAYRHYLKVGADPNIRRSCGWTALHHAACHGYAQLIPELLDKGSEIDGEVSLLLSTSLI